MVVVSVVEDREVDQEVVPSADAEHPEEAASEVLPEQEGASVDVAEDVGSECIIRLMKLGHAFMRRSGLGRGNIQKDRKRQRRRLRLVHQTDIANKSFKTEVLLHSVTTTSSFHRNHNTIANGRGSQIARQYPEDWLSTTCNGRLSALTRR